ncbi:hypothetical protein EJB05_30290, partial [Eragrostis curvula]
MAPDESFKRPGSIPFLWEVQPGIPKQQATEDRGAAATAVLPPTTPRLAPPPAARVSKLASASCRRSSVSSASLSPPPTPPPSSSHRRSMSARFASSLVLPFARRTRRGRAKDDADYCLLYSENIA